MLGNPWRSRERASVIIQVAMWVTDRCRFLFRVLGVQEQPFREIVKARVMLDLRGGQGLDRVTLPILLIMLWLSGILPAVIALPDG